MPKRTAGFAADWITGLVASWVTGLVAGRVAGGTSGLAAGLVAGEASCLVASRVTGLVASWAGLIADSVTVPVADRGISCDSASCAGRIARSAASPVVG